MKPPVELPASRQIFPRDRRQILERAFELQPRRGWRSAASRPAISMAASAANQRAGLIGALAVDAHLPGQDHGLRLLRAIPPGRAPPAARRAASFGLFLLRRSSLGDEQFAASCKASAQARRRTRNSPSSRRCAARAPYGSSSAMACVANSRANWCDFSRPNSAG